VTTTPSRDETFNVNCPHCRKPFSAKLLDGRSERHTGFKCPHCRLFVAFVPTAEQDQTL
jgi:transposase-like protein